MTVGVLRNSSFRRVMTILGAVVLFASVAEPTLALAAPVLNSQQKQEASELATKLLGIIKARSANSSKGDYEGALADAVSGYDADVIAAALADVAGTPGLPANALAAAGQLSSSYAPNGVGQGTGALGGNFGGTPNSTTPGFSGGGGGGGGSNYTGA